jgi:predicted GIY-YIG superfamily endonuclease
MLRDRLLARLRQMGDAPDHQRLAAEVLGIRGASPDLARALVSQALVLEDRHEMWRRAGERIASSAPSTPGVYVLRDEERNALYVGKAVNLRRRLRAHFSHRRWRALRPEMSRASDAEWTEVGSELEALLREATLIHELRPIANVQTAPPALATRAVPRSILRDVIVIVPSVEMDSVELVAARVDGGWVIQRTRRNGVDLAVHVVRLLRFFAPRFLARRPRSVHTAPLAPIVFSWLSGRGADATRLDPHDMVTARELRERLKRLLGDERLFHERIDQR